MRDPVVDREGNSFERLAIVEWVSEHGTSPITRSPLALDDLIPNRALKDAIEDFNNRNISSVAPVEEEQVEEEQVEEENELEQGLTIDLKATELVQELEAHKVMISITPCEGKGRVPIDISCVIDVSGSMNDEAAIKTGSDTSERTGLTILDVVKHAVKTIIKSLNKSDRLALVTFSDTAEIVFPLTKMNVDGQNHALDILNGLCVIGSTNLWAGIEKGLDVLKERSSENSNLLRISSTLVFTDGVPNIVPPRGHLPMLKLYKERCGGALPGSVSTFGFGYNLESETLYELAQEGNGSYAFIPDAAFVGTVFVHAVANLMTIMAKNVCLAIEPLGPVELLPFDQQNFGHTVFSTGMGSIRMDLGCINYGQSVNVVLLLKGLERNADILQVTLKAELPTNPVFEEQKTFKYNESEVISDVNVLDYHFARSLFVCKVMEQKLKLGNLPTETL